MHRYAVTILAITFAGSLEAARNSAEAQAEALDQIVMIGLPGGDSKCNAAGIIVGDDSDSVAIATTAHGLKPGQEVRVRFHPFQDTSYPGKVLSSPFEKQGEGDLAVIRVRKDPALTGFVSGLKWDIKTSAPLPAAGETVHSMGCSLELTWSPGGDKEAFFNAGEGEFLIDSAAQQGQSGGAVFNEAWELIGMVRDIYGGRLGARAIRPIVDRLTKKPVELPVKLRVRLPRDRVLGPYEVARNRVQQQTVRLLGQQVRADLAVKTHERDERAAFLAWEAYRTNQRAGSVEDGQVYDALNAVLDRDGYLVQVTNRGWLAIGQSVGGLELDPYRNRLFVSVFRVAADGALTDGRLLVWSLSNPRQAPAVVLANVAADYLESAGNGAFLVAGSRANILHGSPGMEVWCLSDGTPRSVEVVSRDATVTAVAAAKNADIAAAGTAAAVFVWNLRQLQSPASSIPVPGADALALSADGNLLAVATRDSLSLYDLKRPGAAPARLNGAGCAFGRVREYIPLSRQLSFSNDGSVLACMARVDADHAGVRYWRVRSDSSGVSVGVAAAFPFACGSIVPVGPHSFASACGETVIFDALAASPETQRFATAGTGTAIAASDNRIVTAAGDRVWLRYLAAQPTSAHALSGTSGLAVANQGQSFLFLDGAVRDAIPPVEVRELMIWDHPESGGSVPRKLIASTPVMQFCNGAGDQPVVLVPDSGYRRLALLDVKSAAISPFPPRLPIPQACAATAPGNLAVLYNAAASEASASTTVYDLASGQKLLTTGGTEIGLAISKSGRWLSNGSSWFHLDRGSALADQVLRPVMPTGGGAAAISPDELWLASGPGPITIWKAAGDKPVERATLRGHDSLVTGLIFNRTGSMLASADAEGNIRVWSVDSLDGQSISLKDPGRSVDALAFDATGRRLASRSRDYIRIWALDLDELADRVCQRVFRDMEDAWVSTVGPGISRDAVCTTR